MTSNKRVSCKVNLTESQKIRNERTYKAEYRNERELETVIKGLEQLVSSFSSRSPEECVDFVNAMLDAAYSVSEKRISRKAYDEEERKNAVIFANKVSKQMQTQENFFDERARRSGIVID